MTIIRQRSTAIVTVFGLCSNEIRPRLPDLEAGARLHTLTRHVAYKLSRRARIDIVCLFISGSAFLQRLLTTYLAGCRIRAARKSSLSVVMSILWPSYHVIPNRVPLLACVPDSACSGGQWSADEIMHLDGVPD